MHAVEKKRDFYCNKLHITKEMNITKENRHNWSNLQDEETTPTWGYQSVPCLVQEAGDLPEVLK